MSTDLFLSGKSALRIQTNVKQALRTLQRTRHKNDNVAGLIRFVRCLDSSNGPEELWLTMSRIWSQNRWKRFPKKCFK